MLIHFRVSPKEFLLIAKDICGYSQKMHPKVDRLSEKFKTVFGISAETCAEVFTRIELLVRRPQYKPCTLQPIHLLWALHFMRAYPKLEMLCATFKVGCHKVVMKNIWCCIDRLSLLAYEEILWSKRFRFDNGSVCKVSVDGTDFRIETPKGQSRKYYSHKFKKSGLRYEIAISIQAGDIVWVNGPFPCGEWPDIKIFRKDLKGMLQFGEAVEADDGYRGEPYCVRLPNDIGGSEVHRKIKQDVRSRHEACNRRFKEWEILNQTFRHGVDKHRNIFLSIAALTQIKIRKEHPLWQVSDYRTILSKMEEENRRLWERKAKREK